MRTSDSEHNEESRLLEDDQIEATQDDDTTSSSANSQKKNAAISKSEALALLPIPLFAALAMAATAATTIYAYAALICKDPTHCEDNERNTYAGIVALATCIANVCSLLALGPFERLLRRDRKASLAIWLVCRSMSVVALATGVYFRKLPISLAGQIFEGLASDNMLHFCLNAVYAQVAEDVWVSRLVKGSLALYMVGISISPALASLLGDFRASFIMALSFFVIALLYLFLTWSFGCEEGSWRKLRKLDVKTQDAEPVLGRKHIFSLILTPMKILKSHPWSFLPAISLFIYNFIQSYAFQAIMVHTSIYLGFSSKQNGFLISIAHAVASIYLFVTIFFEALLFKQSSGRQKSRDTKDQVESKTQARLDMSLAEVSILAQATSLALFGFVKKPWQAYGLAATLALGLASPSYIKSYFIMLFPYSEGPKALAALTLMEVLGSLLSPVALGGLQTAQPGKGVFFIAASCMTFAAVLFGTGMLMFRSSQRTAK